VLKRWQKLFGNLTDKQQNFLPRLRANEFLLSLDGQAEPMSGIDASLRQIKIGCAEKRNSQAGSS
jgi:hypothetical protein